MSNSSVVYYSTVCVDAVGIRIPGLCYWPNIKLQHSNLWNYVIQAKANILFGSFKGKAIILGIKHVNIWLILLFQDPERDLWCVMDKKLYLYVQRKTIFRTIARTTAGYTCQVLLNMNSVIDVASFSTVMEYAEWNWLLKAVEAVKTKEAFSKNGTCSIMVFCFLTLIKKGLF